MEKLKDKILDLVKQTESDSKKKSQQARFDLEYIFFPIFDCLCNIRAAYGISKDNDVYINDGVESFDSVYIEEKWQSNAIDWECIFFDTMSKYDNDLWLNFKSCCGMYASIKLDFAVDDEMFEKFAAECRRKVEDKLRQLKKYEEEIEEKLRVDYDSIVQKCRSINDVADDVK